MGNFTPLTNHGSLVGIGLQTAMVSYTLSTLKDQQAARRAGWEARNLGAEADRVRRWAAAYLPLDLI